MSTRVYVVIPRTIDAEDKKLCMTCGRMAAHAAHVAAVLTRASGVDVADQDLIVLSVASSLELANLCYALQAESVSYVEYRDTDKAFTGEVLTAIATWPIERNSSVALKRLRPWCCKCNEQTLGSSEKERSAYNREAAGSIPAPGSKPSNPQGCSEGNLTLGANFHAVPPLERLLSIQVRIHALNGEIKSPFDESVQDILELMLEEIGELAKRASR